MLRNGIKFTPRRSFSWLPVVKKIDKQPILNILADTSIDINEIHDKVERIESLNSIHQKSMNRTTKKLDYILDHIGFDSITENTHLVNDLMNMPLNMIEGMLSNKSISNDRNQLLTIMAHLIFRNQLTIDNFMKIVLKLPIKDIINIQSNLFDDPGHILFKWEIDERTRVMASIVMASKFKIIGDYEKSREIVSSSVLTSWIPSIKSNKLLCSDGQNLLGLLDNMIEYNTLQDIVIKTENTDFMYSFWEKHPKDTLLKESLQHLIDAQTIKGFVINMMQNPVIATDRNYIDKVIQLSRNLHLSSLPESKINEVKFIQWVELLIRELFESTNKEDEGYVESYEELQIMFNNFKKSRCGYNKSKQSYDETYEFIRN